MTDIYVKIYNTKYIIVITELEDHWDEHYTFSLLQCCTDVYIKM